MAVISLSDASIKSGGKRTTFWDQATAWNEGLQLITTQSFSVVSSVSLDNCFSDNYVRYKIVFDATASANMNVTMRMRASSSDETGSVYLRSRLGGNSTSVTALRQSGNTSMFFNRIETTDFNSTFAEIQSPYQTEYTGMIHHYGYLPITQVCVFLDTYGVNNTTSYDGFSLICDAGTITGSVSVLGYYRG